MRRSKHVSHHLNFISSYFSPERNTIHALTNPRHALTRPTTALKAIAITELEKTDPEYTSFVNGLFLDYLGMPTVLSHLDAEIKLFDIPNKIAVTLSTGKVPPVMTHTRDVSRFVVASLSLEKRS